MHLWLIKVTCHWTHDITFTFGIMYSTDELHTDITMLLALLVGVLECVMDIFPYIMILHNQVRKDSHWRILCRWICVYSTICINMVGVLTSVP
jgi:hypothetical protein